MQNCYPCSSSHFNCYPHFHVIPQHSLKMFPCSCKAGQLCRRAEGQPPKLTGLWNKRGLGIDIPQGLWLQLSSHLTDKNFSQEEYLLQTTCKSEGKLRPWRWGSQEGNTGTGVCRSTALTHPLVLCILVLAYCEHLGDWATAIAIKRFYW